MRWIVIIAVSAQVKRDDVLAYLGVAANIIPSIHVLELTEIIVFFFAKEFSGWEKR